MSSWFEPALKRSLVGLRRSLLMAAMLGGACAGTVQPHEERPRALLRTADVLNAPFAPVVRVLDTESSLGPLARQAKTVTIEDLVRYHGHPCDGLAVAAAGIAFGLARLFPEGIVDRTDIVVAVNGSACYGDVAAYLTGARARYGTMVVDPYLGDEWVLARRSTGQAIKVVLRDGLRPPALTASENELRGGGCDAARIASVQKVQRAFGLRVLGMPPGEAFTVTPLARFGYTVGPGRPDTIKAGCGRGGG